MDTPVQWAASAKENYELVIGLFTKLTGLDARRYLDTMLLFDYLICNEDRHLNNFGILLGDATAHSAFHRCLTTAMRSALCRRNTSR